MSDERVFFQVHKADGSVLKLKLSARGSLRHLYAHVPAAPGAAPEDLRLLWHDTLLQASLSPRDYGMAPGETNAHVVKVVFAADESAVSSRSVSEVDGDQQAATTMPALPPHRSVSQQSDASSSRGLAYFSSKKHRPSAHVISTSNEEPTPLPVPSYPESLASTALGGGVRNRRRDEQPHVDPHASPPPARRNDDYHRREYNRTPAPAAADLSSRDVERLRLSVSPLRRGGDPLVRHAPPPPPPVATDDDDEESTMHASSAFDDHRQRHTRRERDERRDDSSRQHQIFPGVPAASSPSPPPAAITEQPPRQANVPAAPQQQQQQQPSSSSAATNSTSAAASASVTSHHLLPATSQDDDNGGGDAVAAALRAEVAQLRQEKSAAERAVESLQSSVSTRDAELASLSRKLLEATTSASAKAHDASEVQRYKTQYEHTKAALDKVRQQLRERDIELLEVQSAARSGEGSDASREVSELKRRLSEVDDGRREREQLRDRVKSQQEALDQHKREAEDLRSECENLRGELEDTRQDYDESMTEMRAAIDNLNAQNEALLAESSVASQNTIRAQSEIQGLRKDAAVAAEVPALKQRVQDLEREVATAASAAQKHLEAEVDKWQRTATDLNQTVQALRGEVATANEAASTAARDTERLRGRLREAEDAAEDAEHELAAQRRTAAKDVARLTAMKAELEAALVECNSAIIAGQKEAARLRQELLQAQQHSIASAPSSRQQHQQQDQQQASQARATTIRDSEPRHYHGVDGTASSSRSASAQQQQQHHHQHQQVAANSPPGRRSLTSDHSQPGAYPAPDPGVPSAAVPPLTPRASRARIPGQTPQQQHQQQQQHHH